MYSRDPALASRCCSFLFRYKNKIESEIIEGAMLESVLSRLIFICNEGRVRYERGFDAKYGVAIVIIANRLVFQEAVSCERDIHSPSKKRIALEVESSRKVDVSRRLTSGSIKTASVEQQP